MLYSHVPLDSLNRYFMSDRSQDFSNKTRVHSWDVLHRLNKFDARLFKQVINIAISDTVDVRNEFHRRRVHSAVTIVDGIAYITSVLLPVR